MQAKSTSPWKLPRKPGEEMRRPERTQATFVPAAAAARNPESLSSMTTVSPAFAPDIYRAR